MTPCSASTRAAPVETTASFDPQRLGHAYDAPAVQEQRARTTYFFRLARFAAVVTR